MTTKRGHDTYAPPSLDERVSKLEREMVALTESRGVSDVVHLREFGQRLLIGDGPLARIKRLAEHMHAAHFGECDCKDPDRCVRRAYEAIVKICEGDL